MDYKAIMVALLGAKLGMRVAESVPAQDLRSADLDALCGAKGAAKVRAAFELASCARRPPGMILESSRTVVRQCWGMGLLLEERVDVFLLDARQRIMRRVTVATGVPASCVVEPRAILAPAIRHGAASIILVHNHPSGDATPSADDLTLTNAVREACSLLGCPLLDHVIIAGESAFSFLDAGLLKAPLASEP